MNIGLIAHDGKKTLMQNFCIAYRGILSKHILFATGTTGRFRYCHRRSVLRASVRGNGGGTAGHQTAL